MSTAYFSSAYGRPPADIRLGVIGYGHRIRHVLGTIDRYRSGARVTAIVDPRAEELRAEFPEGLKEAAVYADAEAMLDSGTLDGVLIGTRCSLHAPYAVQVLERNLPLFLEKPVATSWEQLRALHAAGATSRSPVVVSFPLRVSPLCEMARALIDSGVIGTVEQVQAVNRVPAYGYYYYHYWMRDDRETGGLWLQKATHDFDYINYLVGQRPRRICAMESKTVFTGDMPAGLKCVECDRQEECMESPYNQFYHQGLTDALEPNDWLCSFAVDTGNHDSATAIIEYESGMHAVYSQNFYIRRGAAARGATLIGYRGTLSFDWYQDEIVVHHHHSRRVERHRLEGQGEGHFAGDKELAHDFLDAVVGRPAARAPLEAGILSLHMCLMARDSCASHTFQDYVPLGGAPAGGLREGGSGE
jgi:predicted dehydrogenase